MPHATIIRRRRRLAVGAGLVLLLAVLLTVTNLARGGDSETQAATVPLLGSQLEEASSSAVDRVQRTAAVQAYAKLGMPVYCGAGKQPWVALTFDDGPGELSPRFVELLSEEKVPATVFRVGRVVAGHEKSVEIQRNLGWDSGTHTQNHPPLASLDEAEQRREIVAGNDASERVLGRRPEFFRPPYQSHNATTDRIVKELDQVQILWNVDTQDSLGPTTTDAIVEKAIEGLRPGSIILMHEIKEKTLEAMPKIIAEMRKRKLTPVTISAMLAGDPPSEQQLRDGYSGCLTREADAPAASR